MSAYRMLAAALVVSLVAALGLWSVDAPRAQEPARTLSVTFDDLPWACRALSARAAAERTSHLVTVLRKHRAPTVGFVNEVKLGADESRAAFVDVLRQWADAGATLGNHTFDHADFNTATVGQFEDQILRNETVTREIMAGRPLYQRYFRYPANHTGDTAAKKQAIERFLLERGYRVAVHTIDSSDYVFNAAYVEALDRSNASVALRVRGSYLDFIGEATTFAEHASQQIFSRAITQTLLLHANDLNADTLDDLLTGLERRGYRFVSLDEAMADAAYRTPDMLVTSAGPTWLWRWTKSLGLTVSFREDPDPPAWVMDLYGAATK